MLVNASEFLSLITMISVRILSDSVLWSREPKTSLPIVQELRLLLLSCIIAVGFGLEIQQRTTSCSLNRVWASRPHSVSITEFGAIGDGVTLNTHAFQNAIFYVNTFADKGGAQLYVPAGKWLTGSFNLTSHLTLYLDRDSVILGSQESRDWPLIDPLPSYGRGRELPGGRHCSLIHGYNLTDVVITGDNGTIDGQGDIWWHWFHNHTLNFTRPHLVELRSSTDIVIANLTFLNSPFWNVHPVYSSNVRIQNITILAPPDSPNTDGIDPDSCTDVCIEDCYISTGDDAIAIKSGWDEYGIAFGRPSSSIRIHRIVTESHTSAGLALGSEMSGGITDIHVADLLVFNTETAISVKTSAGRGGYVKNIFISNVTMNNVKYAIGFTGFYGDHPDDRYDPDALPAIDRIIFRDIVGENITVAGHFDGLQEAPFSNICMSNIFFNVTSEAAWNCSNVKGFSESVYPQPCADLQHHISNGSSVCSSSSVSSPLKDL